MFKLLKAEKEKKQENETLKIQLKFLLLFIYNQAVQLVVSDGVSFFQ